MKRGARFLGLLATVAAFGAMWGVTAAQAEGEFWVEGKTFAEAGVAQKEITGTTGEGELLPIFTATIKCAGGVFSGTAYQGGAVSAEILFSGCSVVASKFCQVYEGLEGGEVTGEGHIAATVEGKLQKVGEKSYLLVSGSPLTEFDIYGPLCPIDEGGAEPLQVILKGSYVFYLPSATTNTVSRSLETMTLETLSSLFPKDGIFFGAEKVHLAASHIAAVELVSEEKWSINGSTPPPSQPLAIEVEGEGEVTGTGIACTKAGNGGAECEEEFTEGSKVSLKASAKAGSHFVGWETIEGNAGSCTGSTTSCTTGALAGPTTLKAMFETNGPEFRLEGKTFKEAKITEESIEGSIDGGELSAITGEIEPVCTSGNLNGSVHKGGTVEAHVLYSGCTVSGQKFCNVYEGLGEAGEPETLFGKGHALATGSGEPISHAGSAYLLLEGTGEAKDLSSFYVYGAICPLNEGIEPLHVVLSGSTVLLLPDASKSQTEHAAETLTAATLESQFGKDSLSFNARKALMAGATATTMHLVSGEKWSAEVSTEASEFLLNGKTFAEAGVSEKAIEGSVGEGHFSAVTGEIATTCESGNLDGAVHQGGGADAHVLYNGCAVKGAEADCAVYEGLSKVGEPATLLAKTHVLTTATGKLQPKEGTEHYLLMEGSAKEKQLASFYVYGAECPYNEGTEPLHLILSGSTVLLLSEALKSQVEHALETISPTTLESLFPADDLLLNGEAAEVAEGTSASLHLVSEHTWSAE